MCACVRVQSGGAVVERMARDIFVDRPAASVYLHRDTKKMASGGSLDYIDGIGEDSVSLVTPRS
jgi:hypothetical protein